MVAPFDVIANYSDGTSEKFHKTCEVWKENLKQTKIVINTKKKIKSLQVDGGIFMDADETNNTWLNKQ